MTKTIPEPPPVKSRAEIDAMRRAEFLAFATRKLDFLALHIGRPTAFEPGALRIDFLPLPQSIEAEAERDILGVNCYAVFELTNTISGPAVVDYSPGLAPAARYLSRPLSRDGLISWIEGWQAAINGFLAEFFGGANVDVYSFSGDQLRAAFAGLLEMFFEFRDTHEKPERDGADLAAIAECLEGLSAERQMVDEGVLPHATMQEYARPRTLRDYPAELARISELVNAARHGAPGPVFVVACEAEEEATADFVLEQAEVNALEYLIRRYLDTPGGSIEFRAGLRSAYEKICGDVLPEPLDGEPLRAEERITMPDLQDTPAAATAAALIAEAESQIPPLTLADIRRADTEPPTFAQTIAPLAGRSPENFRPVCSRCGTQENVKGGVCGNCADDLRDRQQAEEL